MFSTGEHENGFSFGTSSSFRPISDEPSINFGPIDESLSQLIPHCDAFTTNLENHYFGDPTSFESMHFYSMDNVENKGHQPAIVADPGKEELQLKRKNDLCEAPKKRTRASRDAQKGKKNVTSEKKLKLEVATKGSGCYSWEEDSNASQELNEGETSESKSISALNSDGKTKTRAGRGAATDPQSLYARKRRERITDRFRILQSLVPNGTKVDISTMLEEAVQYVKFLQLQIKILSSDDLWMYAPIAYNGMDMGLYSKISPSL